MLLLNLITTIFPNYRHNVNTMLILDCEDMYMRKLEVYKGLVRLNDKASWERDAKKFDSSRALLVK